MSDQPRRRNGARKRRDYVVIFGAAVRPDGRPSPVLSHGMEGALAWVRVHLAAMIMPTGGVGKHGPAEAVAMRQGLINAGVAASRIVMERHGRDSHGFELLHKRYSIEDLSRALRRAIDSRSGPRPPPPTVAAD